MAKPKEENLAFDYRQIRMMIGLIAFFLPWVVVLIAFKVPPSISASYHTLARDVFVGLLFVIGALLLAYKGHNRQEEWVSTIGGVAAWVAALFPTKCDAANFPQACNVEPVPSMCGACGVGLNSDIHYLAAFILFSTVVYFCLFAFRRSVVSKLDGSPNPAFTQAMRYAIKGEDRKPSRQGRKVLRLRLYLMCGVSIAAIMLVSIFVSDALKTSYITFWAEAVALGLFGLAWMTASKLWFFGDEGE